MNIFENIKIYDGAKWQVVENRKFSEEEINMIESNNIVSSKHGLSVCFHFKGTSQMGFIPLSNESKLGIGDAVDLNTARLLTLERNGETIQRVEE